MKVEGSKCEMICIELISENFKKLEYISPARVKRFDFFPVLSYSYKEKDQK